MRSGVDARPGWQPGSGYYVAILAVGAVLTQLVLQVLPDWNLGSVPPVAIFVVGYVGLAVVAWVREPAMPRASGLLAWFLLACLALWILGMLLVVLRQEDVSVTVLIMPVMLVMIWVRPPTREGAVRATDVLAIGVVGVVVVSLVAEVTGVLGSWYGPHGAELAAAERDIYWVPLAEPLGLDGRWAGPFVHPNLAGPVGAFLVVYGATRRRGFRLLLIAAGTIVLLLASSRTSWVSAFAGVLALIAFWWVERPSSLSRWVRVAIAVIPVLAFVAAFVAVSPWLGGRASIWPVMADLWRQAPLFGIGKAGFLRAIENGQLPGWADHAHNVVFDALVRTGVVGAGLAVVTFVLAFLITARAAGRGRSAGLALMVMLLVGSMGDTILRWQFVMVPTAALILAVLISADDPDAVDDVSESDPSEQGLPLDPAPAPGSDPGPAPAPTP